jgi:subtilisin
VRQSTQRHLAVASLALGTALGLGPLSPDPTLVAAAAKTSPYVVVLGDHVAAEDWEDKNVSRLGLKPGHRYRHAVRGFSARLTPGQRRALLADSAVAMVAPDRPIELTDLLPTGVDRVEADLSPAARIDGVDGDGHRVDVDIAVIDTGIQPNHPDLNVVGGFNCTGTASAWADWNGHGTHVAGTAAALDNGLGVVGVAPGARLWSVRVFRDSTAARLSWIVCGIDWITAQNDPNDPTKPLIEVVNMSLRDAGLDDGACGTKNADPEHAAICRSVDRGITYVVAAGNDRTLASKWRPASYNEVITVSAMADFDGKAGGTAASTCSSFGQVDRDDTFADFSNYGGDVDLIAPGKCIRSTYRGSSYATISGTSMSSPAVAGGAALYKSIHPEASPSLVRAALRAAGSLDWSYSTDPDGQIDPLLDVSSLGAPPGFEVDLLGGTRTVWAGGNGATVPLRIVRGDGFAGQVDLEIIGSPPGLRASLDRTSLVGLGGLSSILTLAAEPSVPAGTYPLTVRATSSGLVAEDSVNLKVDVDTVNPTVAPPVEHLIKTTLGSRLPVRLSWSAGDVGSGVGLIELFVSRDGGTYSKVALGTAVPTAATRSMLLGHTYRYRVRAVDLSGRVSEWATGPAFRLSGYSESHATVAYRGTWTRASLAAAWGDRLKYTRARGARATFRFTGREVAWVAPKSSGRGWAKVYVDGVLAARVSLYSASTRNRQVVFVKSWPSAGPHTLMVVNEATSGRSRIDVDGFVVLR